MSKKLNLVLIFREKILSMYSTLSFYSENEKFYTAQPWLCFMYQILFIKVVIWFEFSDIYTLFSCNQIMKTHLIYRISTTKDVFFLTHKNQMFSGIFLKTWNGMNLSYSEVSTTNWKLWFCFNMKKDNLIWFTFLKQTRKQDKVTKNISNFYFEKNLVYTSI